MPQWRRKDPPLPASLDAIHPAALHTPSSKLPHGKMGLCKRSPASKAQGFETPPPLYYAGVRMEGRERSRPEKLQRFDRPHPLRHGRRNPDHLQPRPPATFDHPGEIPLTSASTRFELPRDETSREDPQFCASVPAILGHRHKKLRTLRTNHGTARRPALILALRVLTVTEDNRRRSADTEDNLRPVACAVVRASCFGLASHIPASKISREKQFARSPPPPGRTNAEGDQSESNSSRTEERMQ
jgi:hypothetical protein